MFLFLSLGCLIVSLGTAIGASIVAAILSRRESALKKQKQKNEVLAAEGESEGKKDGVLAKAKRDNVAKTHQKTVELLELTRVTGGLSILAACLCLMALLASLYFRSPGA